ncbi:hypothetical protein OAK06_05705 [Gammaproteobacteria bacterium]|nr:hypothetical protein [Gammaproteobacteria bacterium]
MKQILKQNQKTTLTLTPALQNQIKILGFNGLDIREEFNRLLEETDEDLDKKTIKHFRDELLIDSYRKFLQGHDEIKKNPDLVDFKDLRSNLEEQFMLLTLKRSDYLIGEYLIDSIEPEGRLDPEIDYDDIKVLVFESFKEKISNHDIERVLDKIQELEPVGCGYRSITESLTIQIRNLDIEQKLIISTTEAINNISLHKTTIDKLDKEIQEIIKGLNYHPGLAIESEGAIYTKPDLVAIKKNKDWFVSLNDSYMPKAVLENINRKLNSLDSDKKVEIKSFLNGLERRQQTLLLVGEFLLKKQEGFLNKQTHPIPITLMEIGEALKLSESTISRVVQSKYIQLPDKLISLNSLLERRVNAKSDGRDISPRELERLLVKLTSEEDKEVPYTDENLRCILKESYSVDIARRTISKYREGINIPIARFRKEE